MLHGYKPLPASPVVLSRFVVDIAQLGIDRVWEAVQEISRAHYVLDLADPTLGFPVAAAINEISKVDPPRSWPPQEKERWKTLPYDIQKIITTREADRDREVRRMQNELAQPEKGKRCRN
jgi:hypothetical protein